MKFELFVSIDCGCSYQKDRDTDDIDALRPRMCELDAAGERWYVTEDGKDTNVCCAIHRAIMSDIGIKTPNVELTGAAAGLSPQRPATEGSEVERRVGPLDGKCGFCGAVAHAGEEWGYTKDLAQQWVLSCPRCCSEAGGAVREIAANGLPGASKW